MVVIEPESTPMEEGEGKLFRPGEEGEGGACEVSASNEEDGEGFETASEGEGGGDDGEDGPSANEVADEQAKKEALNRANDAKSEGNKLVGAGKYEDALTQYFLSLQFAPNMPSSVEIRSNCHANSALCYSKLGKYEDAIKECTKAIELNPSYLKAFLRRGDNHEKLEQYEEAIADMKKALELDPSDDQARRAIHRLEPLAAEKREKMKEEMIGKLKDMGNSLLGRFGMSLDNFKAVKDPNTGSYSISFQK